MPTRRGILHFSIKLNSIRFLYRWSCWVELHHFHRHSLRPFQSIYSNEFFAFTFIVEHALCMVCGVFRVQICSNHTSIEGFFKQNWPQVYTKSNYDNGIRGFFIEWLNYYCTFQWTFMDIFIISISVCLSTRVNQLNEHLKQYKGMVSSFWFPISRVRTQAVNHFQKWNWL